jgi:hypothetical protein
MHWIFNQEDKKKHIFKCFIIYSFSDNTKSDQLLEMFKQIKENRTNEIYHLKLLLFNLAKEIYWE